MLLCCHGDRCRPCSPRGLILLWLSLCSVLPWFLTVILILLSSLLLTHCLLCLHSPPHPLHIFPPTIITHPLDHPLRLGQPLQPHPSQPVRRLGGPAGPSPTGGAGQDDAHVPVESGYRAGLAGGCHGDAHVHPQLLRERQERKGRAESQTDAGSTSAAATAKTLAFCRFYSGWQMKTWSWV